MQHISITHSSLHIKILLFYTKANAHKHKVATTHTPPSTSNGLSMQESSKSTTRHPHQPDYAPLFKTKHREEERGQAFKHEDVCKEKKPFTNHCTPSN